MMGAAPAVEFLERLGEERRHYVATLPGTLAGMELLWRAIAQDDAAPGDLERLVRIAHGLAGSGGVFGFDALGKEARALELALRCVLASGRPAANAQRSAIAAAIAAVRDCIAPSI